MEQWYYLVIEIDYTNSVLIKLIKDKIQRRRNKIIVMILKGFE
jgi:hypothetical protein